MTQPTASVEMSVQEIRTIMRALASLPLAMLDPDHDSRLMLVQRLRGIDRQMLTNAMTADKGADK
jgi:hypothetical protein